MNTPHVPYSDEVEHTQPNEEAVIAATVASMGRVNQRVYAKGLTVKKRKANCNQCSYMVHRIFSSEKH